MNKQTKRIVALTALTSATLSSFLIAKKHHQKTTATKSDIGFNMNQVTDVDNITDLKKITNAIYATLNTNLFVNSQTTSKLSSTDKANAKYAHFIDTLQILKTVYSDRIEFFNAMINYTKAIQDKYELTDEHKNDLVQSIVKTEFDNQKIATDIFQLILDILEAVDETTEQNLLLQLKSKTDDLTEIEEFLETSNI